MSVEKVHGAGYKYPSVTTILGILRKPALEYYFKTHTPEFIEEESKKAKEIGTALHDAIYNHIEKTGIDTDTNYPEEVKIGIESFLLFKKENSDIVLKRAEREIESDKWKFSGKLDCVGERRSSLIILDWKSGKKDKDGNRKIYDEAKYQTAAYVVGYNEKHGTDIEDAMVVALGKDAVGYAKEELGEKEIKKNFEVFKHAAAIYYLQRKTPLKKKKEVKI